MQPIYVSDQTCYELLGLSPRQFRRVVRSRKVRHTRLGRRVLVCVRDWDAAMGTDATPEVEDGVDADLEAIAARLGLEVVR